MAFFLFWSSPSWAADDAAELSKARRVYSQGLTLEAAGDWAGALSSFEEVARIKMTPQVRYHIARCKEHLGRLNEALGGYRMAEYEASAGGPKERELLDEAQKAREALETRIPKLVIVRGRGAETIKIELDGVTLGDAQIGQEIAVDPGPHVVVGTLATRKSFKQSVSVSERDKVRVVLDVPAELEGGRPEPAVAEPAARQTPSEPEHDRSQAPDAPRSSALPWVVGGIGVVSLAASAVFYKLRNDAEKELEAECIGRTCPDTLEGTQQRGQRYATLSGVTLGLGVAAIGTATILLISNRSPAKKEARASLPASRAALPAAALRVQPRGATLELGARF